MDTTIFFLSCLVSGCLQKFLDKNFPKGGKGPQQKKKKKKKRKKRLPSWT